MWKIKIAPLSPNHATSFIAIFRRELSWLVWKTWPSSFARRLCWSRWYLYRRRHCRIVRSGTYRRWSPNGLTLICFCPYRRCWCDRFNYRRGRYVRWSLRWWLWRVLSQALSQSLASRVGDTTPLSCNSKVPQFCHRANIPRSHGFFKCHSQWGWLRNDQHLQLWFQFLWLALAIPRPSERVKMGAISLCNMTAAISAVYCGPVYIARGSGDPVRMLTSLSESIKYPP